MTWNTLMFFAEVLPVTAANGNLDHWSIMVNTYFPLGNGPRKSTFNISQTSFGKRDDWIFAGGVGRPVDWQAIQLFISSSIALSMVIKKLCFSSKLLFFAHLDAQHEKVLQHYNEI